MARKDGGIDAGSSMSPHYRIVGGFPATTEATGVAATSTALTQYGQSIGRNRNRVEETWKAKEWSMATHLSSQVT